MRVAFQHGTRRGKHASGTLSAQLESDGSWLSARPILKRIRGDLSVMGGGWPLAEPVQQVTQVSLVWESAVIHPRFASVLEDDIQELLECVRFNEHIFAQIRLIDEIYERTVRFVQGLPLVGREIGEHGEKRSTKRSHMANRLSSFVLP